jgi:hypothetical protein
MLGSKNQLIKNRQTFNKSKTAQKAKSSKSVLERLYLFFDYLNFDAVRLPVTEDNPVETLIVSIGEKSPDDDETELKKDYLREHTIIKMLYVNDIVNTAIKTENIPEKENYYILQFYSKLPIKFKLEKFWKIHQLLHALSQVLPIGSLEIDKNKEIYYRYTLLTEHKEISYETVFNIFKIIDFFLRRFRRKITDFAEGRVIITDIFADLENGKFADW